MPDPAAGHRSESPRSLFEASLPEIDGIIGSAARRMALRPDEAGDFKSWVHLKLIQDDYGVVRKFGGRSSLASFLSVVVQNLARDYQVRNWGRWRPSAAAQRMGTAAVQLEILLERDGFSLDEACESLRANHGVRMSRLEIVELAGRLPKRARPRLEGGEGIDSLAAPTRADQRVKEGERRMTLSRAKKALSRSLAALEVTDRLVLKMHYESGLRISAIARALGLKQRELYTRRDRCLRELRRGLESAGLEGVEVLEALGWKEADFRVELGPREAEESQSDPSNVMEPRTEDNS